jgi:hypothetical protein
VACARIPESTHAADESLPVAALFVAPRLCAPIVDANHPIPFGGESWKTSRVMLPPALRNRTFRHEITGAEIRPTIASDSAWIFLGELFQTVPVAILSIL